MSDAKMILILLIVFAFVAWNDDGAAQRWCDTYKLSEPEIHGADHE